MLAVKGDANDEVRLKDIDAEMFVLNESETLKLNDKVYKALFKSDSLGECGTLFHMKTALRRNDVNGNVKSNYKAHEELLLLIVKALIHIASDEIKDCREQNRDIVLSSVFSKIYGLYSLGYSTEDYVCNYFTNLLTWGMQIVNMNDTAKEGDMERLIMNMKENAAFFYSHSAMSKYFSECINTILQVDHLSSPHMKMRQLEGAFVNTKGGNGKNKEADLVQEHAIRNQKDLIRGLGKKNRFSLQSACYPASILGKW
ncbi:uncharacterized protein LOC127710328 [Mytilus californianus]|uniref:uncharacterized protein LOC127710328 n=1 Tax=Mytilus californianus TaxID=6549 RepID=UPI002246E7FC|nr:uncharacterized protein LOC127710328 [Mytilus californianus]